MSKTVSGFLACISAMFLVAAAGSALFDNNTITFVFVLAAGAFGALSATPYIESWLDAHAGSSHPRPHSH